MKNPYISILFALLGATLMVVGILRAKQRIGSPDEAWIPWLCTGIIGAWVLLWNLAFAIFELWTDIETP